MDENILNELIDYLKDLEPTMESELPDLQLYMDQVTAFMDTHLSKLKRHQEDKALTKTMINNYTKNHLLPPPSKKRYSKNHLLMLLFIYYYKGILSLDDIELLFRPIIQNYFDENASMQLSEIYNEVFSIKDIEKAKIISDLKQKFEEAKSTFSEDNPDYPEYKSLSESEREGLRLFSFVSILSFDVYLKKKLIELVIDKLRSQNPKSQAKK